VASEQILFFSSDATQLYKADIFRCLAAPDCFTIQFRYAEQWVHPNIFKAPANIRDRSGIVIFVAGNDENSRKEQVPLRFYPIRFCTVKDAFFDSDTQQIIVIIALGRFIACDFDSDQGPPTHYLTFGRELNHEALHWLDSVRRLESEFPNVVFFSLKSVLTGSERVQPTYLSDNRTSCFDLEEEATYSLELVYYDPSGAGASPLVIRQDSDRVEFSNTFAFGAGTALDKRLIHAKTGLLASRTARIFTTISCNAGENSKDPNYLQVLWRISRWKWKDLVFAVCVLPGAVGLGVAALVSKSASDWLSILAALLGAGLVAASGGLLYRFFNKT
jgi:hypothetical protein